MKRLMTAALPLIFGAALLQAAPAHAGSGGVVFDITSIQVDDHAVRSGGCHNIPITATHSGPSFISYISADVEVWNGPKYVGEAFLTDGGPGRLEGGFHYCSFKGLGKFRLGPSEISWAGVTATDFLEGDIKSSTTANFSILQDARVSKLKAKRSGKRITFTGKSSWYSVESSRWRADPKGWKFALQRQSSNGSWRTIKRARVGKKGFSIKVTAPRRATYRVVTEAGSTTWAGVSKTIRK